MAYQGVSANLTSFSLLQRNQTLDIFSSFGWKRKIIFVQNIYISVYIHHYRSLPTFVDTSVPRCIKHQNQLPSIEFINKPKRIVVSQIYDYTGLLVMALSSVKPSQLVKLQRLCKTNTKSRAVLKDVKYMICLSKYMYVLRHNLICQADLQGRKQSIILSISKGNSGYHMSYFTLLLYKVTISGNAIR